VGDAVSDPRPFDQRLRFCTTSDGVRLAYASVGSGPPLVRAAHWLSHLEFDWETPVWRPWLEAMSQRLTYLRYDERGSGLSDWDVGFEAWVRDLETVVDAAGLPRFSLYGVSQGGPIAVAYAARHPERVERLILHGSYLRGVRHRGLPQRDLDEQSAMLDLIRLGWGRDNPAFRQLFATLMMPGGSRALHDAFNELQRVSASPENAARIVEAFTDLDVTDLAPQVRAPTLVLHARGDARAPFAEGRLAASLVPDARFVALETDNHILLEGEPAFGRFMDEVHAFLGVEGPTGAPRDDPALDDLTPRERQVLDGLAAGRSNKQIAQTLFLSPKTVRNYVSILFSKLGVASRSEAIVRAREAGFGRDEG
jgi:pimeloyl-ACP methyl ester carboxylesterase/DNA-binding CsgD family transcriptional regulator